MSLRPLLAALLIACAFTGCTNVYEDSPSLDGFDTTPPSAPAPAEPAH